MKYHELIEEIKVDTGNKLRESMIGKIIIPPPSSSNYSVDVDYFTGCMDVEFKLMYNTTCDPRQSPDIIKDIVSNYCEAIISNIRANNYKAICVREFSIIADTHFLSKDDLIEIFIRVNLGR